MSWDWTEEEDEALIAAAENAYSKLEGFDYGYGALEGAARTASNNSKAIGRLCHVLGLSEEQIEKVLWR